MFDYRLGHRFFGDDMFLYDENGICLDTRPSVKHVNILREMTYEDKSRFKEPSYVDRVRYIMEEGIDTQSYISNHHSDFRVQPGGLYINRMGYLVLLDVLKETKYKDISRFVGRTHPLSSMMSWSVKGLINENGIPCIQDLLFQRR